MAAVEERNGASGLAGGSVTSEGSRELRHRFATGLVVGKFAPLHLGHEWLIEQAARQCERLLILSYTKPEFDRCEPEARDRWFRQRFPQHEAIVLDDARLQTMCSSQSVAVRPIPPNGATDGVHQEYLAWLLRCVVKRAPDAMFCSELYGPSCVRVLSDALEHRVTAVVVDPARKHFPCSSSQIRRDPHGLRCWLSPDVRIAFVRRIVILGGESSGKTTLAAALAARFDTTWVPEYGRELWEQRGGGLREDDLLHIGREQVRLEEQALVSANAYLFCDTSPLTTAGYASWMFGRTEPVLSELAQRRYDGAVLCRPDFPFVQDGTRRDAGFRLRQHGWYQERVTRLGCPVLEVGGAVAARVARVAAWLPDLGRAAP